MPTTNYFISYYEIPCAYSPNWYGELNYSPPATTLLYNDIEGYCVGYMNSQLPPGVTAITQEQAQFLMSILNPYNPDIWMGDRLVHRWDNQ